MTGREQQREDVLRRLAGRPIVLVGMMGAGKTTVGRRLAARLGRHFVDSDEEVERAANMTIPEIFAAHGEELLPRCMFAQSSPARNTRHRI